MRVIDRILEYLHHHRLTPSHFERAVGIANGYLKKQQQGKGTVGSEILEKIGRHYKDLSLFWVLTGNGSMLLEAAYPPVEATGQWSEEKTVYSPDDQTVKLLKDKITILENALADKEKIIRLLEKSLKEEAK